MNDRPPATRSELWDPPRDGKLWLQVCRSCAAAHYPPQELCRECLADDLAWKEIDASGRLLSFTVLHASVEAYFRKRLPWLVGLVELERGPVLFAHLAVETPRIGMALHVGVLEDAAGQAVLAAAEDPVPGGSTVENWLARRQA
jgi:uncharacterized OB-fold protein